jgi:hypothetical protein
MKKVLNKIVTLALLAVGFTSCSKDFTDDLVKDNKPEIPVTFEGATTYGFNPYYEVSLASTGDSAITLKATIPADARLKIKEVTKVIWGGTGITPGDLTKESTPSYLPAPIPSTDGRTVTISTNVREFNTKVTGSARITTPFPSGATFIERAYMMILTMDDGSTIIPVQCRIRVKQ